MRYLMNFSYDGSNFNGYQSQKNGKSIQGEIQRCLKVITKEEIKIHATGRTDVGVHAITQYAHFDINQYYEPNKLAYVINNLVDNGIYIKKIWIVQPDFHARYDAILKEYIYYINTGGYDPLQHKYIYQLNKKLNLKKMKKASRLLIGKHDFRNYTTGQIEKENCVRTIKKCKISKQKGIIKISFLGDGFLRHMVRNIVGVLIDIGLEQKEISYITKIFDNSSVRRSKSVSGEGLYLNRIWFKKKIAK